MTDSTADAGAFASAGWQRVLDPAAQENPLDAHPLWQEICALLDRMSATAGPAERRACFLRFSELANELGSDLVDEQVPEVIQVAAVWQFAKRAVWNLPLILEEVAAIAWDDAMEAPARQRAWRVRTVAGEIATFLGRRGVHVVSGPGTVQ